ncbi:hypothetical protein AK830_g7514 [Neonectria ditissima]|uniref:DNA endonuclease activator Ctp1 C-terminal domain-containing protein n=1 Tax=Neonectria ditissima TaxID=78410 RepID=A0A0P7AWZ9_9HYPO|nr:hypothetical protein AK830_g7514 [Neonectria ditissima]
MTSFFQTGRPELLSAIVEACGRVDEAIRKDHEAVAFQLEQAHKERDAQIAQVTELTVKNSHLRGQMRAAKARRDNHNPGNLSPIISSRPADSRGSDGEYDWKTECRRVGSKFNALSENFKKAKDALRKRKDERDQWVEYAKTLEKKIRAAEEEHGIRIVERNTRSGQTPTNPDVKAEAGEASPTTSFTSDPGLEQADLELPPLAAASLRLEQDDAAAHAVNPQSESTQGGSDPREPEELPELPAQNEGDDVQIKNEPSSDLPVVVSERAVRKRKRDGPEPTESPLRKVKLELTVGSSPIFSMEGSAADLQESVDLGDVAQRMLTPRKRKDLEDSTTGGQARINTLAAATTPAPLFVRPDHNPQTARPLDFSPALTPLSVNSVNRKVTRPGWSKPVTPFKRGLSHGISTLAEDGIIYKRGSTEGQPKSAMKPIPKGRLDTLLNSPAAQDDETITRTKPRSRIKFHVPPDLPIPGRRELPFEQEARARDTTAVQQPSTLNRPKFKLTNTKLSPQDARSPLANKSSTSLLRNKPPSELRPDDFKVNPLTNDGHDFAYTEVVRDRNERACLQGCTDMHCCGKEFRALAISQRPNPPLTPAQRMEEQKLLEDYMGESAYRLGMMEKPERDELWIEAKTQELANKYGKHRHRFSRMRSPPGFWNADFPSTQELQADRAEATKRDKQTVQERYREAMRSGGKWIFRDE